MPDVTSPVGFAGAESLVNLAFTIGILLLFGATFVAAASLIVRYRRPAATNDRS